MIKNNKGITLIALIITIIILLILAGVTINVLMGDNGLLNIAKQAGEKYEKAAIKEELESYILDIQISNYMNITMQDVIDELPIKCPGVEWIDIDGAEPIGEYKGYEFKVKSDYTVEILEKVKGVRPEITKVEIEENGSPLESVNIKITATATDGKTITSVIEEKSNTSLVQNADGTYSLNGITKNGVYIIKVTDSEGRTRINNVEIKEFKAVVIVNAEEHGTTQGSGTYEIGKEIQLQAIADEKYKFKGWYVGNTEISNDNPFTYEVQKEITITAKFEFDGTLISSITLKESAVKIDQSSTTGIQLEYEIQPTNATDKSVIWEVEKPNLLTVTNGKAIPKGISGTTKVICKALYGNAKAECTVEINEYYKVIKNIEQGIILDNPDEKLIKGSKYEATVMVSDTDSFILATLEVTMAGKKVDVTNGKIKIDNVTGDIRISATKGRAMYLIKSGILVNNGYSLVGGGTSHLEQKDGFVECRIEGPTQGSAVYWKINGTR